jgi:ankyrin repeat protein
MEVRSRYCCALPWCTVACGICQTVEGSERTALHQAVANGCSEIVAFLLDHGASLSVADVRTWVRLRRGTETFTNSIACIRVYMCACACASAVARLGSCCCVPAYRVRVHVKKQVEGNTPLHIACEYARVDAASVLISRGASLDAANVRIPLNLSFARMLMSSW